MPWQKKIYSLDKLNMLLPDDWKILFGFRNPGYPVVELEVDGNLF